MVTSSTTTFGTGWTGVGERGSKIVDERTRAKNDMATMSPHEHRRRESGHYEGKYSMDSGGGACSNFHRHETDVYKNYDADDTGDECAQQASYLRWVEGNEMLEREGRRLESLFANLVCSQERCDMLSK